MEKKMYSFWGEVFQMSKDEIRKVLPIKWDAVKLGIAIAWAAVAVGISFVFGVARDWQTAGNIFLALFGADILVIFVLWASTPVLAIFILPWIAQRHGREQRDLLEQSRSWDRLARGELVKLEADNLKDTARIEIENGEDNNPFNGVLYITEISGRPRFNPMQLFSDGNNIHAIPHIGYMVTLGKLSENDFRISSNQAQFSLGDGEYKIKTHLEGKFLEGHNFIVEKSQEWRLVINIKDKLVHLEGIDE
jgi:hypothetical protein